EGQKHAIDEYHAFDGDVTITLHETDGLPGDGRGDLGPYGRDRGRPGGVPGRLAGRCPGPGPVQAHARDQE
ncbi:hypothetical protein, partial [Streptomyces sp. NPDC102360]|uniref:hypothetical protein n=1 Tax=Streptomyces sp. NPDC102360 TaxID=3366160 RepID=UPI003824441C